MDLRRLEALLEALRAEVPKQQARLAAMLDAIRELRHDKRRLAQAGLILDEIAREKLYRLQGHRNLSSMLAAELGISRATASRWRALPNDPHAFTPTEPTPRRAQPSLPRAEHARAAALRARLRRRGLDELTLELFERDGRTMLRLELPAEHATKLRW